jgi:hypothetical protein
VFKIRLKRCRSLWMPGKVPQASSPTLPPPPTDLLLCNML